MKKIFTQLLLVSLLAGACDKVKDTPEPDAFGTLEPKTVTVATVVRGSTDIDIVGQNGFATDVTIRINRQPAHGQIVLDAARKVFVYTPSPFFSGYDTAGYEACKNTCKQGLITFFVQDTTSPCILAVSSYSFEVEAGQTTTLTLPDTFGCDGLITSLANVPVALQNYIELTADQKVIVALPANAAAGSYPFDFTVCTPDGQCQTAQIVLQVQNPCAAVFEAVDDIAGPFNSVDLSRSFSVKKAIANDIACDTSDILMDSVSIVASPPGATAQISNPQPDIYFIKLVRMATGVGTYPVTYRIKSRSGAVSEAKVFFQFQ